LRSPAGGSWAAVRRTEVGGQDELPARVRELLENE
jgi:hypothetical protein